ncbi:MAG: DNA repair protein RecO [Ruminococcaceae bacterium]|nr:DNA repair protein RecO [Oscillospiraceae bacterium]
MELIKTTGVVIRRTQVKDNDLILTLFTKDFGVIKVSARGARGFRNKLAAGTALFAYSEFVLYPGRDMYKMNSCELIESFYSLTTNIERLAFATYVADLTGYTVQEEQDADTERLLSLFLNTFYLFARWGGDLRLVKCVFELKLLVFLGLMPCLTECMSCGGEAGYYLSPESGGLVCANCAGQLEDAKPISASCLEAMHYVFNHDDKKAFAFRVSPTVLEELEGHVAALLSEYIDHDFFSLDYLNTVLGK